MTLKLASFEAHASFMEGDFSHPALSRVQFVLADDKPNKNGQGIEQEDFADLAKTAINMPIKMRLQRSAIGEHPGAVTIGHITNVNESETEGVHQLIADGVLYASEFPREVDFLKTAFAAAKAPGVSWEINYAKAIVKNGINWLKGVVTTAATFVKTPAYGTRTALLALASEGNLTEEEFNRELLALASEGNTTQGGTNVTEEELKALKKKADKADKLEEDLKTAQTELASTKVELKTATESLTAQAGEIATFKKAALVTERVAKYQAAGLQLDSDPVKLAAKQDFLAELPEKAFAEYIADIAAAKKASAATGTGGSASAGYTGAGIPNLRDDNNTGDGTSLLERVRAARPNL